MIRASFLYLDYRNSSALFQKEAALWILSGTKLSFQCKQEGSIDDRFWLGDEPYKLYMRGWTMEQLQTLALRVSNYKMGMERKIR
jgi:hypothetical protein